MVSFYLEFLYIFVLTITALSQALPTDVSEHDEEEPKTLMKRLPAGVYPVLIIDELKKRKDIDPNLSIKNHKNKYISKRNQVINTDHKEDSKSDNKLIDNPKTQRPDVVVSKAQNNTSTIIVIKANVSEESIKYTTVTESVDKVKIGDKEMGCFYDTLYNDEDCSEEIKAITKRIVNIVKSNNSVSNNNTQRLTKIDKEVDTVNIVNTIFTVVPTVSNNIAIQTKANSGSTKSGNDENKINYIQTDEDLRHEQHVNITKNEIVNFAVNLLHQDPLFESKGLPMNVTKNLFRYLLNVLLSNYLLDKPSEMPAIMSLLSSGKYAEAEVEITSVTPPILETSSTIVTEPDNHGLNSTSNMTVPRNALTLINTGNIIKLNTTIAVDEYKVIINNETMMPGVHFVNTNISNEEYIDYVANMVSSRSFGTHDLGTFGKRAKKKLIKAIVQNIAQGMVLIINSGTISGLNLNINIINEKNCVPLSNSNEVEITSGRPETTNDDSDEDITGSDSTEATDETDNLGSTVKMNGVTTE